MLLASDLIRADETIMLGRWNDMNGFNVDGVKTLERGKPYRINVATGVILRTRIDDYGFDAECPDIKHASRMLRSIRALNAIN
jgi:hypothetical protein